MILELGVNKNRAVRNCYEPLMAAKLKIIQYGRAYKLIVYLSLKKVVNRMSFWPYEQSFFMFFNVLNPIMGSSRTDLE